MSAPAPGVFVGVHGDVPVRQGGQVGIQAVVEEELLVRNRPQSHQGQTRHRKIICRRLSRLRCKLNVGQKVPQIFKTCLILEGAGVRRDGADYI